MKYLARLFFRITMLPFVQLFYRVRRTGVGFVPRQGGVLLLPNHVSYIDSFIIYLTCPRPVRFVILEDYMRVKAIAWFLKLFGAIPIRKTHAKEAIHRTVAALEEGDVVCLFPEGGLTRLGVIYEFKKGFELIVRKSGCPVVPVYMDGLWNSIFSFERGRYFKKRPLGWTCPLQVAFGRPIPAEEATVDRVREGVWGQSVEAFSLRRSFDKPLEEALVRGLKKRRRRSFLVEYGKDGPRDWSRAHTLGMATAMARRWMNQSKDDGDRIGILLPPGPMSVVINYGLFLAGKTPVNLPFTIDQRETEAVAKSIAPLGIRTVITSRAFMPHLMDFWQGDEGVFIDMKSVVSSPGPGVNLFERMRALFEPAWLTCWRLDLGKRSIDREAVGLVRRPGEDPVLLSSRELMSNATQVTAASFLTLDENIFSEESLCSPVGLMMGCWAPVLAKGKVVSRSFSMRDNFDELERAVLEQGVGVTVGSRSFYEQTRQPLSIQSLQYGILLGRANQWEIEDWEEVIELPLARAWEAHGRIVTMSRTDPNQANVAHHAHQQGRNSKSVGLFLPGVAPQLRDGRFWLRFDPVGEEMTEGNWLEGPSEAEIDEKGFLFFRGRDFSD
ncbi:MAG: 1-acyl-sn-glycerol-3-phosphate acyltransferase [Verrucomicrobiota bacterium]